MCGIVAYTGLKKPIFSSLKLMSASMHDRGKDGVGILFNNRVIKGFGYTTGTNKSNPKEYFTEYSFPAFNDKFENNTVIIHNRARSKGYVTESQLHPWTYVTVDEETGEEITHFFAHNGTLDEEELCTEYKLNSKDFLTDSHVLGHIITHYGFDVLKKYKGAAAFVYTRTDKPNTIVAWKGASRQSTDEIEEERPLHYMMDKTGVYFASTSSALQIAFDISGAETISEYIKSVPDNTLMIFDFSNKKPEVTASHFERSHIPKKETTYYHNSVHKNGVGTDSTNGNSTNSQYAKIEVRRVTDEPHVVTNYGQKIYYCRGKYYSNGHEVTTLPGLEKGTLLSETGLFKTLKSSTDKPAWDEHYLWFFQGFMLKDKEHFDYVKSQGWSKKTLIKKPHLIVPHLHKQHFFWYFDNNRKLVIHTDRYDYDVTQLQQISPTIPFSYGDYQFLLKENKIIVNRRPYVNSYKSNLNNTRMHIGPGVSKTVDLFGDKESAKNKYDGTDFPPYDSRSLVFNSSIITDLYSTTNWNQLNTEQTMSIKKQNEAIKILSDAYSLTTDAIEDLSIDLESFLANIYNDLTEDQKKEVDPVIKKIELLTLLYEERETFKQQIVC